MGKYAPLMRSLWNAFIAAVSFALARTYIGDETMAQRQVNFIFKYKSIIPFPTKYSLLVYLTSLPSTKPTYGPSAHLLLPIA